MRRSVIGVAVAALGGVGCSRATSQLAPVVCPASAPAPSALLADRLKLRPPTSMFGAPYTLVLDERIVAVIQDPADSVEVGRAFRSIDPATIMAIEVIRAPAARQRYPRATGDVLHITRCHPLASSPSNR